MTLELSAGEQIHTVAVFDIGGAYLGRAKNVIRKRCEVCKRRESDVLWHKKNGHLLLLCYECAEEASNATWPHLGLTPTGGAILSNRMLERKHQITWETRPIAKARRKEEDGTDSDING